MATRTSTVAPAATQQPQLVRLGFVPEAAQKAEQLGATALTKAKQIAPAPVAERLEQVEEAVAARAAPYIAQAQDVGTNLLKSADATVDKALNRMSQAYADNAAFLQSQIERQKQLHSANLEAYREARDAYLRKVEEAVEFLKTNGLTGAAKAAADEVVARVRDARALPGYLLTKVEEAWERLARLPVVQPLVNASLSVYKGVHDNVVRTDAYKSAYDLAQAILERGEKTSLWRTAAPYLQPVAETKYYQIAVRELQPKAASA